jgi:hypothetical protein
MGAREERLSRAGTGWRIRATPGGRPWSPDKIAPGVLKCADLVEVSDDGPHGHLKRHYRQRHDLTSELWAASKTNGRVGVTTLDERVVVPAWFPAPWFPAPRNIARRGCYTSHRRKQMKPYQLLVPMTIALFSTASAQTTPIPATGLCNTGLTPASPLPIGCTASK